MLRSIVASAGILVASAALAAGPSQYTPSSLPGTLYKTAPATLIDGQQSTLLSDPKGNLNVNIAATASGAIVTTPGITTFTPKGYCKLTVPTTAVATSTCSGGIPAGTTYALVCNGSLATRWRDDGVSPTASLGMPLTKEPAAVQPVCQIFTSSLANLRWISQDAVNPSSLDISFYSSP